MNLGRLRLNDCRDRYYYWLLASYILSMVMVGELLIPLLNYRILALPASAVNFNQLLLFSNIIPGLPFLASAIVSVAANQISYRYQIRAGWIITTVIGLLLCLRPQLTLISVMALIAGLCLIYRGLYFSLERVLTTTLAAKIQNFQTDLTWGSAIYGLLALKLGAWLYSWHAQLALASCYLLCNLGFFYGLYQLVPAMPNLTISKPLKVAANWRQLLKILSLQPGLIQHLMVMSGFSLSLGSASLLVLVKFHHQGYPAVQYSNLLLISQGVVITSLAWFKYILSIRPWSHRYLCLIQFLVSLSLLILAITSSWAGLCVAVAINNCASTWYYLTINAMLFKRLSHHPYLQHHTPLINGCLASWLYLVGVLAQIGANWGLAHGLSVNTLYQLAAVMALGCVLIYANSSHPLAS